MQNVFISEEARLEFRLDLRKAVIKEVLEYAEVEKVDIADVLNNLLFAVDGVFEKFE